MKALVMGGLGFMGYHLAKKLKNQGHDVVVVDAMINYLPNNFDTWNFYIQYRKNELEKMSVSFIIEDIHTANLKQIIHQTNPEWIINLASMPIALLADLNPQHAKKDIFDSNFNLLEVLKSFNKNILRYVYISSSMVYGNFERDEKGDIIPATENQACKPIDTYGAFKAANELLIQQYAYRYQIPFTIIRPSAVYGPTDANLRVTEIFIKKAIKGESLTLDNGGQHQLDFTYIDDLIEGIWLALISAKANNEIFNITYGEGRKIADLAHIVKQYFPNITIQNNECKPYRPNRGALNIHKARTLLGYSPQYSLEKGIAKYIDFIKQIETV
ncbi:MAG: NAD-dependent epimerase/dehydratase family protein [Bacteroidales bacterium]|nr:NAD-dependent epimerase/dehydratase family protein [Bacteroidales bacterium]